MAREPEEYAHPSLVDGSTITLHNHKLNDSADPDGDVNFNEQQALAFVIELRTDDPGTPATGRIWLRTDL